MKAQVIAGRAAISARSDFHNVIGNNGWLGVVVRQATTGSCSAARDCPVV